MKKQMKKLTLAKETVRMLDLDGVEGAGQPILSLNGNVTCYTCIYKTCYGC